MLACVWFCGSHTANVVAKQFDRRTSLFDLTNKISHTVTDNAVNILKALNLQGFDDVAPDIISDYFYEDDDYYYDYDDDGHAIPPVVLDNSLWDILISNLWTLCFSDTVNRPLKCIVLC